MALITSVEEEQRRRELVMPFLQMYLMLLVASAVVSGQTVEVTATTDPQKVKGILAKEREAANANRAYFDEDERCRGFLKAKQWFPAELSCRKAMILVDKLPKEHALSKSSARKYLAISLIWQQKFLEGIELLKKSLELGKPVIDDSDSETGEIYFLLGQIYHVMGDIQSARAFYEKAEKTYRTAFLEIGDSEFQSSYGRTIRSIVKAHFELLKSSGMDVEAVTMRARLDEVEKEFAKHLND